MKWNTYFFEKVSSTNDVAKDYPVFSAIVTKEQTLGRGRYGRTWIAVSGNLYLSVVLPFFESKTPLLAFVVGVAVATALKEFHVRLKWPNDVLLNGQKLAGILLENQGDKIIAGIGVNVAKAPDGNLPYPVASLNGIQTAVQTCQAILEQMSVYLTLFEEKGFEPIRQEWLALAHGMNQEIEVRLPQETIRGRFIDITPLGALDLELTDQTHRLITAGDVFFINEGK